MLDPCHFFTAGQKPTALAVADLGSEVTAPDGSTTVGPPDGHPDLIVADSGIHGEWRVRRWLERRVILPGLVDDQGQFSASACPQRLAPGQAPQSLALGD